MEVNTRAVQSPHSYMNPPNRQYELPRLQVPSYSLVQSQPQESPSHCHWKTLTSSSSQPISRMRMMANFFRPVPKPSSPQSISSVVPSSHSTGGGGSGSLLPSFHEMLLRTKSFVMQRPHTELFTQGMDKDKPSTSEQYISQVLPVANWKSQAPPPLDMERITKECDGSDTCLDVSTPTRTHTLYTNSTHSYGKCTSKRRERWTEEEHVRFLDGLHRYGRKWKKIQMVVPTKTAIQIRTHAYGFFAKLVRNMPENETNSSSKRRIEPMTDANGMDILRRFVFTKRFSMETNKEEEESEVVSTPTSSPSSHKESNETSPFSSPLTIQKPLNEWN